jgi:hypothetical protein
MGKHYSDSEKTIFLTELKYHSCRKAAALAGIKPTAAKELKARVGDLEVYHLEHGLPPPTIEEKIARKVGSGGNHTKEPTLTEEEVKLIFDACTADKASRAKRQHHVAWELGFNQVRSTIEHRMRQHGLYRVNSTKKLGLTDIQRAERYEIALSRKDWGYEEWSKVIFSDEASILVGEKRGQQKISRTIEERHHKDCIDRRYNNYSEAMFWACFTYHHKGPCHIYYKETAKQKEEYDALIKKNNNKEIEAEAREAFDTREADKAEEWRQKGRKKPGKPASWDAF